MIMRFGILIVSVTLFFIGAGDLLANIDNLSNMSPEWIRTGNRNAATDAADIVVYNPGGVTELPDGYQVNIGNQSLMRKPTHSYNLGMGSESHQQDNTDWFLPNVYITYNKDDWAIFGGYYIPAGGAVADYPDGSITTDMIGMNLLLPNPVLGGAPAFDTYTDEYLEAESVYHTLHLAGAYKINDMVSASLGIRYISVENSIKAGLTGVNLGLGGALPTTKYEVDVTEEGDGMGVIAGVNLNLTPSLNLAMQYQSKVGLDLETSVGRDDIHKFSDGEEKPRDLPGMFGIGLGYDFSDKLYAEVNYSYWFQKECDWGKDASGRDIADLAGDTQSAGITVSYRFIPALLASVGATYTDFLWNDMDAYYEANLGSYEVLYTDNWHIGCGLAYTFKKDMTLNLSLARTIWDDADLTDSRVPVPGGITINTNNETTIIALGFNVGF
jgi:long-chain fatty acid transport protein